MQKVLITGGAGFIGTALAGRLLQAGIDVVLADNLHPQVHAGQRLPVLPAGAQFVPFDVTGEGAWSALINATRPDGIVHLAAETGTAQSLSEAGRHASVNVVGTAALTDALGRSKHTPRIIVLSSSRAVYGDGAWLDGDEQVFYPGRRSRAQLERQVWDHTDTQGRVGQPLPHAAATLHPHPISVYGATKLTQEHILATWCEAHGCNLTVLRLQNVYGPGQSLTNPYTGVLSLFTRLALRKEPVRVFEDGNIVRDFVFIDDVVLAMRLALQQALPGIHTFDVGSGEAVTLRTVAERLAQRCEAPEPHVTGEFRHGDVRSAFTDIAPVETALDYRPKVGIDEGLGRLVGWIADQVAPAAGGAHANAC